MEALLLLKKLGDLAKHNLLLLALVIYLISGLITFSSSMLWHDQSDEGDVITRSNVSSVSIQSEGFEEVFPFRGPSTVRITTEVLEYESGEKTLKITK